MTDAEINVLVEEHRAMRAEYQGQPHSLETSNAEIQRTAREAGGSAAGAFFDKMPAGGGSASTP